LMAEMDKQEQELKKWVINQDASYLCV
jgi:hypothetical protein